MLQRIRLAMSVRDENLTLAGYIEMDEAFFGGRSKRKQAQEPSTNKIMTVVAVESEGKQAGNMVIKTIRSAHYQELQNALRDKIESEPAGQWFRTDAFGSHHAILGLGHKVTMTKMNNVELDEQMKCVSLAISHAKRFFKGTYHHFCKMHIQRYFDEFTYRWNRRHLEAELASHLIQACCLCKQFVYEQLISPKPPTNEVLVAA
jgi:hypothetical protein